MIFISTGSGIAPYRSYILSNNISNFRLIHGVRTTDDIVETETFSKGDVEYCISRENNHNYFKGRVTDYLNEVDNDLFSKDNMFFICGNKDMIADVYDLLINKYNISSSNIDSETFF